MDTQHLFHAKGASIVKHMLQHAAHRPVRMNCRGSPTEALSKYYRGPHLKILLHTARNPVTASVSSFMFPRADRYGYNLACPQPGAARYWLSATGLFPRATPRQDFRNRATLSVRSAPLSGARRDSQGPGAGN